MTHTNAFHRRPAAARWVAAALLASLSSGTGCARIARLDIVRPALLNAAPFGNTYQVHAFEGDVESVVYVQSRLRQRIANSLNRSIALVEAQGGLVFVGAIPRVEYSQSETRNNVRCTHRERVNGRERNVDHTCTEITRIGVVETQVEFRIVQGSTGQVLATRVYDSSESVRVRGRIGPYASDFIPFPLIDQRALRDGALEDAVERFSRVILPWRDHLELNFEGCAGEARCTQGFDAVQAGRLDVAEALFTAVVGDDTSPVAEQQRERVGEAHYNRAMVRTIQNNYIGASADLQRAIGLLPQRDVYRARLHELEILARDQQLLRQQLAQPAQPAAVSGGEPVPDAQPQPQPQPAQSAQPIAL